MDESGAYGQLAACGVTFLVIVALNRELRRRGWFTARAEPDLRVLLDLVALGTVCDVVPLSGLNRAFVAQGIRVMGMRGNPGLDRKSGVLGKSVSVRVDLGGRGIIKKQKKQQHKYS